MNGHWTGDSKMTWLRFQLYVDGTHNQYIWVNLADVIVIKEYSLDDGTKLSSISLRENYRYDVLGWAGDLLKEVQDSQ